MHGLNTIVAMNRKGAKKLPARDISFTAPKLPVKASAAQPKAVPAKRAA